MSVTIVSQAERDLAKIVNIVRQLCNGRNNAVGTLTLATGVATTTVTAPNCATGSTVSLTPLTASAATEIGNGTLYVSTVANGSFTVTHANSAVADRSFAWAAIG